MGRECGTAESDDTGLLHRCNDLLARKALPIGDQSPAWHLRRITIHRDPHRGLVLPARMGPGSDRSDPPGSRSVDRRGDESVCGRDGVAALDVVSDAYHQGRGRARVLL